MTTEHNEQQWPEYLMLRDTGIYDDAGGLGQRIFTTAGAGYEKQKYVRAELGAQPAAAQEAVAWQVGDEFYPSESLAIEAIQQWGPSGAIAIPLYAAAPVTAAPADTWFADQLTAMGEVIPLASTSAATAGNRTSVDSGALTLAINVLRRAGKDEVADALEATAMRGAPAAPGIDLEQFRPFVELERGYIANRIDRCDAIGTSERLTVLQAELANADRLLRRIDDSRLIDASPKGGSEVLVTDASARHMLEGIHRANGGSLSNRYFTDKQVEGMRSMMIAALQASDAEVRP